MRTRRRRRRSSSAPSLGFALLLVALGFAYLAANTISVALERGDIARTILWILVVAVFGIAILAIWKPRRTFAIVRWAWGYWRRSRLERTVEQWVAPGRTPIPAGLRFAVLRRDGFRCVYCGHGEPDGAKLHLDHLVPVSRGGLTNLGNLVTACQDCNLGKSAMDLVGAD
jgi:hypothetical protein